VEGRARGLRGVGPFIGKQRGEERWGGLKLCTRLSSRKEAGSEQGFGVRLDAAIIVSTSHSRNRVQRPVGEEKAEASNVKIQGEGELKRSTTRKQIF